MSKKVKEQVKYNPSYSSLQRTTKVFKALIGNTNRWLCVFYLRATAPGVRRQRYTTP